MTRRRPSLEIEMTRTRNELETLRTANDRCPHEEQSKRIRELQGRLRVIEETGTCSICGAVSHDVTPVNAFLSVCIKCEMKHCKPRRRPGDDEKEIAGRTLDGELTIAMRAALRLARLGPLEDAGGGRYGVNIRGVVQDDVTIQATTLQVLTRRRFLDCHPKRQYWTSKRYVLAGEHPDQWGAG